MKISKKPVLNACIAGILLYLIIIFGISISSNEQTDRLDFIASKTGIPPHKILLLDYFIFMPWPVGNLMEVEHFRIVDYDDPVEGPGALVVLAVRSIYFLTGAVTMFILVGTGQKRKLRNLKEGLWRPSTLFIVGMTVVHIFLLLITVTYYTGLGGPAWIYPSPYFLVFFVVWMVIISWLGRIIASFTKKVSP